MQQCTTSTSLPSICPGFITRLQMHYHVIIVTVHCLAATGPSSANSATSAGPVSGSAAELGLPGVDKLVQELLDKGIAKSTWAVYQSGWQQYLKFCRECNQSPLPLSKQHVCQFAAVLSKSVTWKTIRIYLIALRFFQIRVGLPFLHSHALLKYSRAYIASYPTITRSSASPLQCNFFLHGTMSGLRPQSF